MSNNRVEIYNTAQDNPKMKEIYDILLLAGYFRIRIQSISDFDKMVGGLTWCITCSYFEIDIDFNDEMKLGEKIKLSEKICNVLKQMECPYPLQPFQIQGLDSNAIFPVIQWLIKFVYQTREQRQAFHENMTYFLSKKAYKSIQDTEDQKKKQLQGLQSNYLKRNDPRVSKNSKIKKTAKRDPLRVYSALIEYGDVTAYKTYNKLCAIMSGKISLEEKGGKLSSKVSHFEEKQQQLKAKSSGQQQKSEQEATVNALLFHGSTADEKLTMTKNTDDNNNNDNNDVNIDLPGEIDFALDEDQIKNFKNIDNAIGGKIGEKIADLIDAEEINNVITEQENQKEEEDNTLNITKLIQNEKQFHEGQVQAMKQKITQLGTDIEELSEELYQLQESEQQATETFNQHQGLYEELSETQNTLQTKIDELEKKKQMSQEERQKAQELVELKTELDNRKKMIKKMIKQEQLELQQEQERVEQQIPQWENTEEYITDLYQEVQEKKEKYDEKFKQLAQLNQEISVLQRKLEALPSPTEIAQYHQRLQELFENVNQENLKYKDKLIQFNGSTDVKDMLTQFVEIMRTFKENFALNRKSKSGRERFITELGDTRKAMLGNLEKSRQYLQNQVKSRETKYSALLQNQQSEREYYQLLKQLRMEFEKGDELQYQLDSLQQS